MAGSRPSVPAFPPNEEYGSHGGGLNAAEREPWPAISSRIGESELYWLATTRPDGRPHAVPIGGAWNEDRLYFNMSPRTVSARNLAGGAPVCVHLESGMEVVIIEGVATVLPPPDVPASVLEDYGRKYGGGVSYDPADSELPWFALEPHRVLFWLGADIRNTALRWVFSCGRK
jgi:hypothetical protein